MYTYEQIFGNKSKILFVIAHPDDVLVYFAALVYRLRKDKKEVYVVTASNGARGSRDNMISEEALAKQRIKEELEALEFLHVPKENFACLNYKDGEIESNLKLIGEISKYIRKYKADIVCTHEPTAVYQPTYKRDGFFVNHRDHRKVGEAVVDSAYPFSRDRSFFPEHAKEGIEPHTVKELLLTDEIESNFDFDYTPYVEIKKKALLIYKSQFDKAGVLDIVDSVKFDNRYLEKFFYVKLLW